MQIPFLILGDPFGQCDCRSEIPVLAHYDRNVVGVFIRKSDEIDCKANVYALFLPARIYPPSVYVNSSTCQIP